MSAYTISEMVQHPLHTVCALVLPKTNVPLRGGASIFFRTVAGFFSSGMSFLGTSGTLKISFVFKNVSFHSVYSRRHNKGSHNMEDILFFNKTRSQTELVQRHFFTNGC